MNTLLYHATYRMNLPLILAHGLAERSYWAGDEALADYYLGTCADEEPSVLLVVDLADLDEAALQPDLPGIEEPITSVLDMNEDEVRSRWAELPGTWRISLDLVGSLRYDRRIPGDLLRVAVGDDTLWLAEYLAAQPASPVTD